ncbi:hypothetical protein, conserved [Trypanosoma brucei gambiense DAL972]|uniref:Uncharacterized protein n=2 Tax=Trypanosoma brucei TaxID=5691 RepID=C9ZXW7_TRYB9|nr:hypothetical protein, conserved [Trypanosoma brucei gambiense DAL972]RHW70511.1 hypothetical protein DPX39_090030300 [Trypanosoma brucei equiperdum]CBH14262.1 hypothetical protein, conserved [Trypanosoma brucei gambiense DAL972]|eukprot:XP_011776532.1 hypothetical protein, conserved [Trypanosoma brucei gambiense DAL972]
MILRGRLSAALILSSYRTVVTPVAPPRYVRRRIRESMVRHVLTAAQPLTVSDLIDLVRGTCDVEGYASAHREEQGDASFPNSSSDEQPPTHAVGTEKERQVRHLTNFLVANTPEQGDTSSSSYKKQSNYLIESTVRLLLAVDPQFRVSVGGYVCYPNLPSMIIASTNVERNESWVRSMRSLVRAEEAAHRTTVDCNDNRTTRRIVSARAEEGAPSRGWSYIVSLWCMLDPLSETPEENDVGRRDLKQDTQCSKRNASRGGGSFSEHLAELWIKTYDSKELPPLLCEGSPTGGWPGARPCEFRECTEGNDALRRWCAETREGYVNDLLLAKAVLAPAAKTLLQQVNFHMAYLFNLIVGVPITLGRLSALVQWESHPFAMHYRSFLHFVVLFTGCSAVLQMERYEMRRREVQKRWRSLLWVQVHEEWERQRQQQLVGRFASRTLVDEAHANTRTGQVEAALANVSGTSDDYGDIGGTPRVSLGAEHYRFWVTSTSGPSVSPKFADVCRCVFLMPSAGMAPVDVTTRSPSEVMDDLAAMEQRNGEEKGGTVNDIVVFAATPFVLEQRICRLVRLWWLLEGQRTSQDRTNDVVITIRRLSQLCLWEHEYGNPAASRMMLHYLQSSEHTEGVIKLVPPPEQSVTKPDSVDTAGQWLVVVSRAKKTGKKSAEIDGS